MASQSPAMRTPGHEPERLSALHALRIVGTSPEAHFDALCRTAQSLFSVPIALVSLIDEDQQWFKARCGLDICGTARSLAFCSHAILADDVMVVEDATRDPRFRDNALVTGEPGIRFYAGAPLVVGPGIRLGTICIIDTVPRAFSAEDSDRLADLAAIALAHLRLQELRLASEAQAEAHRASEAVIADRNRELLRRERGLRAANDLLSLAENLAHIGHWRITIATGTVQTSAGFERIFGRPAAPGAFMVSDHLASVHPADRRRTRRKIRELNAGKIDSYENRSRILRPDGEIRVIVSRGVAERGPDGSVVTVFGICVDVTEAAQVEAELRRNTALLSSTVDNMDQGLFVIDPDSRISLINRRGLQILDFPEEWLTTKPSPAEVTAYQARRGEVCAWSEATPDGPVLVRPANGERRIFERMRSNGTALEIRAVGVPDGSVIWTCSDVTAQRRAERALQESETHFRLLAEATSDMIIRRDATGTARYVSPASFDLLGYTPDEVRSLGFEALHHPDDAEHTLGALRDLRAGGRDRMQATSRLRHKDGRWIWVDGRVQLVRDAAGAPRETVSTLRDLTDRIAIEDRLRQNETRLALALDSGNDGLWDWNVGTGEVWRSGRCWDLLGRDGDEALPVSDILQHVVHTADRRRVETALRDALRGRTPTFECEFRFRTKSGEAIWVLARGKVVERDPGGAAVRMIGTLIDVTTRKDADDRIAHMARHDALTDLPNRAHFRDQLGQRLAEVNRQGGTLAVLCLDLDRFKAVNDTLGHPVGDLVLREIAGRLRHALRPEDSVARLGGDEFAVLVANTNPAQAVARLDTLAERLIAIVNEPVIIDGQEMTVGLTIGVAVAPADGIEADSIFKRADLALYRAKAEGRNTFRFFETGMDEALAERRRLELDLRRAVARGEFEVHYQPVLDTRIGAFTGFEALLRWRHPERGLVSPADFIPIAEETGLIVAIGEWILRAACRDAMSWENSGLKVSVNVSGVQFRQPGLMDSIASALAASGLEAGRLELEITESVLIGSGDAVLSTVQTIRSLGIRVALDDFGTGYSSLSYLHRFPFDRVKIDRSFVRDIASPKTAAIVRATVDLAHRLGMAVTVEGIETAEQLGLVRAEGCTEIQGYLISRPVSAADAQTLAMLARADRAA